MISYFTNCQSVHHLSLFSETCLVSCIRYKFANATLLARSSHCQQSLYCVRVYGCTIAIRRFENSSGRVKSAKNMFALHNYSSVSKSLRWSYLTNQVTAIWQEAKREFPNMVKQQIRKGPASLVVCNVNNGIEGRMNPLLGSSCQSSWATSCYPM